MTKPIEFNRVAVHVSGCKGVKIFKRKPGETNDEFESRILSWVKQRPCGLNYNAMHRAICASLRLNGPVMFDSYSSRSGKCSVTVLAAAS